jgi:diphthamide synthase (EF-2-diphthine--ammonia ligase)
VFDRVAMHAVRRILLEGQAEAAGLPLLTIPLPWPCSNEAYEAAMRTGLADAQSRFRMTHVAFGDLFLEDIRAYREEKLQGTGLTPLFPVWGIPTAQLARDMIAGGLQAVITCVDPRRLAPTFAGRAFDPQLLADLPPEVDPCGENGEFHTFVHAGPMFRKPLSVSVGEVVERDGFVFADVEPSEPSIFDADGALTREYLLSRGYCCENGCRNCPYGFRDPA